MARAVDWGVGLAYDCRVLRQLSVSLFTKRLIHRSTVLSHLGGFVNEMDLVNEIRDPSAHRPADFVCKSHFMLATP